IAVRPRAHAKTGSSSISPEAPRRSWGSFAKVEPASDWTLFLDRSKRGVKDSDGNVGFALRENQRRREEDCVASGAKNQHPVPEALVDDGVAFLGGALFRVTIAHELDTDHQAAAAHVAD